MSYAVSILRRAQRELEGLPREEFARVAHALRGLAAVPRPPGCRKLTGRNAWRVRIGSYRVIYEIDDRRRTVLVVHVGHRRDAYR